jgi:oxygen-dependent protoporphyrinogen oxidase
MKVIVIGGGISGLATAFNIERKAVQEGIKVDLTLIEASKKLGGKVRTFTKNDFRIEEGVNGFLDNKPSTLELVSALGVEDELLPSSDHARKRFIYCDGELKRLPESPGAFLRSDLLSIKGRLRVALEIFTKPKPEGKEESVADFARRHLGSEAVDKLIAPMVSGVFAGDAEKLSMQSCFPLLLEVEKAGKGSLIKGMLARMKEAKKAGKRVKATAGPGGTLVSFKKGMGFLIEVLEKKIKGNIIKGKKVVGVEENEKYTVYLEEEAPIDADVVVAAFPAYSMADVLKAIDLKICGELRKIPYVPLSVVALAFNKNEIPKLDGFGFLIARNENRKILGTLWTSSIFPGRSPPGQFLTRTMVGGALQPELALLEEEEMVSMVKEELEDLLKIKAEPTLVKVFKHEKAIPQYVIGHPERLRIIEERLKEHPGVFLTGNAFRGIGINDCTRNASIIAEKVIGYLKAN